MSCSVTLGPGLSPQPSVRTRSDWHRSPVGAIEPSPRPISNSRCPSWTSTVFPRLCDYFRSLSAFQKSITLSATLGMILGLRSDPDILRRLVESDAELARARSWVLRSWPSDGGTTSTLGVSHGSTERFSLRITPTVRQALTERLPE